MAAISRRNFLILLAGATYCQPPGGSAHAAIPADRTALVMIEEAGCPYCARWKREVEASYRASPEGRFAPLEFWQIGSPEAKALGRVVYTPTFVLVARGSEVGRIIGYTGADFFWGEIEMLFKRAGYVAQ